MCGCMRSNYWSTCNITVGTALATRGFMLTKYKCNLRCLCSYFSRNLMLISSNWLPSIIYDNEACWSATFLQAEKPKIIMLTLIVALQFSLFKQKVLPGHEFSSGMLWERKGYYTNSDKHHKNYRWVIRMDTPKSPAFNYAVSPFNGLEIDKWQGVTVLHSMLEADSVRLWQTTGVGNQVMSA